MKKITGDFGLLMMKDLNWRAEPNMTIDVSTSLTSLRKYLNMGLSVFPIRARDKKPPKLFKWDSFQHMLPAEEQVNSLFCSTDINIVICTEATSLIHRHTTALQIPWREKEDWP
jgi:hypothetical protein